MIPANLRHDAALERDAAALQSAEVERQLESGFSADAPQFAAQGSLVTRSNISGATSMRTTSRPAARAPDVVPAQNSSTASICASRSV